MIEAIGDLIKALGRKILEFINGIIQAIGDAISSVFSFFVGILNNLWLDYIKPLLVQLKDWALHQLNNTTNDVIEATGAADWLFENQSTVVSAIHWIDNANGIFPLVELVAGVGIILACAVVALPLKIIVKAVRG